MSKLKFFLEDTGSESDKKLNNTLNKIPPIIKYPIFIFLGILLFLIGVFIGEAFGYAINNLMGW